ncbi:putative ClpP/crotonase-like domain-containing protein [Medicago truncatula]|uniref:Putative ClpP/crotonase-like domain-containing protein n=1 Tax=Medicago truncatula TaxID=3880 RepID=A0A396HV43_MEDTR|nr:putative ClpP/crotonase-like domain-containing protein [Medicago truncatula]
MLSWTHSQTLYRTTSRPFFTSFQSHFSSSSSNTEDYPTGDFNFEPLIGYNKFLVRLNMKFALPSKRVKDGAYDPCISAVYLHIDHLSWGWAKLDEIQRQILNFRKSGKMVVAYVPSIQPTEYYLACACDEIFAPCDESFSPPHPQFGLFFGLTSHLIALFLKDSYLRGKRREEVENFINEGVYQVDKLKNEGFISSLVHDDHEVINLLKKRLGGVKSLPMISFEKYSKVRKWTVGISEAKEQIAIIRVSGTMGTDIVTSKFIEKIGMVKASKEIKAVIIRIDSTGGDVRDSQLMWKEIRSLPAEKPVVASMSFNV